MFTLTSLSARLADPCEILDKVSAKRREGLYKHDGKHDEACPFMRVPRLTPDEEKRSKEQQTLEEKKNTNRVDALFLVHAEGRMFRSDGTRDT
jgi:hypothetical protein